MQKQIHQSFFQNEFQIELRLLTQVYRQQKSASACRASSSETSRKGSDRCSVVLSG
jgi:hypothetical protein